MHVPKLLSDWMPDLPQYLKQVYKLEDMIQK